MRKFIESPKKFKQAIRKGLIREVSPDLFGTLTHSSFGTLTKRERKYAWVSSSSNLYQLLVLNQRYKVNESDDQSPITLVSEEALDGLTRIVGVPNPPFNDIFDDGGIGRKTSTSQLMVFKDKNNKIIQDPVIPTFENFIKLINSNRGNNPIKLPRSVGVKLSERYQLLSGDPRKAYEKLTGYPNGNEERRNVYEKVKRILSRTNIIPGNWPEGKHPPFGHGTRQYTQAFFRKFANDYLFKNNLSENDLINLQIGVRVLLDDVYSASPLFTGLGVGYRLGANPLIGKSNENLDARERLTGHEFLVLNTNWWKNFHQNRYINTGFPDNGRVRNNMRDESDQAMVEFFESEKRDATAWRDGYLKQAEDGYFNLQTPTRINSTHSIKVFHNQSEDRHFKDLHHIISSGIIFKSKNNSLSDDTIDAKGIAESENLFSRQDLKKKGINVKENNILWKSLKSKEFAFFCNTGGGVDKITGSNLNDIIISSQWQADHGMSTIFAGDGDDVISPGRGANLLYSGKGNDLILLASKELFGDLTLMDFAKNDDKVSFSKDINYQGLGTDLLVVGDANDPLNHKRLMLTGNSKQVWQEADILFLD